MIGLVDLIDQHGEALEFDLIRMGLRLRDFPSPVFSWRDLIVIVRQARPDSALYVSVHGEDALWGLPESLLALIADASHVANWQRAGGKRSDYPRPIPRPGVKPDSTRYGSDPIPIEDMAAWLGWDEPKELTEGRR